MAKIKKITKKRIQANKRNAQKGGRPKGSVSEETRMRMEMREQLTAKVQEEFDDLMSAFVDLAKGHFVGVTNPDGIVVKVYKKSPDSKSLGYLMDQMIGKAVQPIDIDDTKAQKMTMERFMQLQNEVNSLKPYEQGKKNKTKAAKKTTAKSQKARK